MTHDESDGSLLDRFRAGDRAAFVDVYRAHAPAVRAVATRFFSSPFEQEEAVQEIWLTAHRMSRAYDPGRGALLPWLRALAANRCRELLRAKGRRPPEGAEAETEPIDHAPGPEADAGRARLREAVGRFAATLPKDEARYLELGLAGGLSHEEVARELGTNERRCKYLKKKVLARAAADPGLRAALDELGGGP